MKKQLTVVIAASSVAVAAACGSAALHGRVTGKEYVPPSTSFITVPSYATRCSVRTATRYAGGRVTYYSYQSCSQVYVGVHLVPDYTPECYQIAVGADTECVSQSFYDQTKIGDDI